MHARAASSESTVTEPPLDKMTSGDPIIIQIKTLLNEANQVAAARTLL